MGDSLWEARGMLLMILEERLPKMVFELGTNVPLATALVARTSSPVRKPSVAEVGLPFAHFNLLKGYPM